MLTRRIGAKFRFTHSEEEFRAYKGPGINYSHVDIPGSVQIMPEGLLSETHIKSRLITAQAHAAWHFIFFRNASGAIPFDPFAAAFYLLSRYEEYIPQQPDKHSRFPHEASLADRTGFLGIPLLDRWCLQLKELLHGAFPQIAFEPPTYSAATIVDVDFAYMYRGVPPGRLALKLLNSMRRLRFKDAFEGVSVLLNRVEDPYDTYEEIGRLAMKHSIPLQYFILMSNSGGHDKNIPPASAAMGALLKRISVANEIGLHPSYRTNVQGNLLMKEKKLLESQLQKTVTRSRQHFLKLVFPHTYRSLVEANIAEDYSMQFSGACGFRASTAHPFNWFDLSRNEVLPLLVHPVMMMDVTLKDYMALAPDAAIALVMQLVAETKQVNGTFISAWHNSSMTNKGSWEGWKMVFEKVQEIAAA